MGSGGSARKLILDGLVIELSSDNDPKFTIGGRYITGKQDTTGEPFFLTDNVNGALTGLEARLSHKDGSLDSFDAILKKCADTGPVSALYQTADGTKYTAVGGANAMPDGAADGMVSIREGKCTFGVFPKGGKWTKG